MSDSIEVTNRSKASAGLYIIATPIGNRGDITERAINLLKECDYLACEDTRTTQKLLTHLGIKPKLLSYNDHSTENVRHKIIQLIEAGHKVGLVSDAGTPLISDPGYKLVRQAQEHGLYITTLPGASSVIAALTLSGLPTDRFLFEGFLPSKQHARQTALETLKPIPATLVFFESARRLQAALEDFYTVLGNRETAVIREITKLFEETKRDTLSNLITYYKERGNPKGEVVIVVAPPAKTTFDITHLDTAIDTALQDMSLKDAVHYVTEQTGLPKKQVYQRALERKNADNH